MKRGPTNLHMAPGKAIPLPGRGLAIAWAPDGHALAVGGHFRERDTKLRYDTRIADVASGQVTRSFSCHYWWVVATAWVNNPYVGEVIADGGGDHAVKIWDANGPGSTRCNPGQILAADGGIEMLPEIGGWTTALAFSPDGRFLAGASRDRTIRIWQIEPGPDQWKVVSALYEEIGGNILSVAWSPDGRRLAAGDRIGRVGVWSFDPVADRWDAATIASFERTWFDAQPGWFRHNAAVAIRAPLWTDGGHRTVWNVRFSPDGSRVAAAGADGVLSVFDAATGAVAYRTGAPRVSSLHGLAWSPDGRLLATGAADNYIYVFDAATGAPYDVLEGHADLVTAVAWSPDGTTLASTAGGQLISLPLNQIVTGPDQAVRLWTFREKSNPNIDLRARSARGRAERARSGDPPGLARWGEEQSSSLHPDLAIAGRLLLSAAGPRSGPGGTDRWRSVSARSRRRSARKPAPGSLPTCRAIVRCAPT